MFRCFGTYYPQKLYRPRRKHTHNTRVQLVWKIIYSEERNDWYTVGFQQTIFRWTNMKKHSSEPMCVILCRQLFFIFKYISLSLTCTKYAVLSWHADANVQNVNVNCKQVFSLKVNNFIPIFWHLVELHCHPHCLLFE